MNSKLLSQLYKIRDSIKFDEYRNLRKEMFYIIKNDNSTLDYGSGYFYQNCPTINLSGLRNTKYRSETLRLKEIAKDKSILDIGCNIGSMIFYELKGHFVDGIEYNKYCVEAANCVKKYLELKKIKFFCHDFLKYKFEKKYDVILSLANHHTYDGGIDDTEAYFFKIKNLLSKRGEIYLESHHPQIESNDFFLKIINDYLMDEFQIIRQGQYKSRNFFDNGRVFLHLKKKL